MADYVSEHLAALRRKIADHSHGGLVMTSEAVDQMVGVLRDIEDLAKILEHEVSRHRWNIKARAEREEREALEKAISDPAGKVVIFPRSRSTFSGGDAA